MRCRLRVCALLLGLLVGCSEVRGGEVAPAVQEAAAEAPVEPQVSEATDVFQELLAVDAPLTDGFSSPVTGAWDRCGPGCWERGRPGVVYSPANARVLSTAGGQLSLQTQYYENHQKVVLVLVFQGVQTDLRVGQSTSRGAALGLASRVELRLVGHDEPAELFIAARPSLPVPQREPVLALIHHDSYTMRIYRDGAATGTYAVSFGQEPCVKQRRGDNRTPKGLYYVVARSTGPFDGTYGAWYGGYWMKLNYPNAYDAARGVDQGLITPAQQVAISRAWRDRRLTLTDTSLGGGIGLHGWASEWEDDGPRHLSWGCVVLHLRDVAEVYGRLTEGAMVVLF